TIGSILPIRSPKWPSSLLSRAVSSCSGNPDPVNSRSTQTSMSAPTGHTPSRAWPVRASNSSSGSPSPWPDDPVVPDRQVPAPARVVRPRPWALGALTARVPPDRQVVSEAHGKPPTAAPLAPPLAVEPGEATDVTTADTHTPERRTVVKHETNGHPPNGRHDP